MFTLAYCIPIQILDAPISRIIIHFSLRTDNSVVIQVDDSLVGSFIPEGEKVTTRKRAEFDPRSTRK